MKHVLFEAIGQVDDGYLTRAEKLLEASSHRGTGRKLWTVALAAAICASTLAATAMATGWKTGIFQALGDTAQEPGEQALFQAAASANTEPAPEFAPIPELDMSKLVLLEKYFDGQTILLGYDMEAILPRPAVGVEVDAQTIAKITQGNPAGGLFWSGPREQLESPATKNAEKYGMTGYGLSLDRDLQTILTKEEYETMWNILEDQGYVVIAAQNAYVSDHILVDGQRLREPWTEEYKTDLGTCRRMDSLPETVQDADGVTVTLRLKSGLWYYYLDLEGNAFLSCDHTDSQDFSFLIERSLEK